MSLSHQRRRLRHKTPPVRIGRMGMSATLVPTPDSYQTMVVVVEEAVPYSPQAPMAVSQPQVVTLRYSFVQMAHGHRPLEVSRSVVLSHGPGPPLTQDTFSPTAKQSAEPPIRPYSQRSPSHPRSTAPLAI